MALVGHGSNRFHYPAVGDASAIAGSCCSTQCVAKRDKACDTILHAGEMPTGDGAGLVAVLIGIGRQGNKRSDFIY